MAIEVKHSELREKPVSCQHEAAATPADPAGNQEAWPLRLISLDSLVVYHTQCRSWCLCVCLTVVWHYIDINTHQEVF